MINLLTGLVLLSVVISLIFVLMAENLCLKERIKGGLLALLVIWVVYAGFAGFYLAGTGLGELENARYQAELKERLQR